MTIADHIREETVEITTYNFVKGLFEDNVDKNLIAKYVKLPLKKVEAIIQKIEKTS